MHWWKSFVGMALEMNLFRRTDEAWKSSLEDESVRSDIESKSRMNRALTLASSILLIALFLILSFFDAPVAEIIGVLGAINFALFLKSDSDVKQAIVVSRLTASRAKAGGESSTGSKSD